MFRRLRVGMTLLYLVAALLLVALVAGGTYFVVYNYFQTSNDLALQHRMADEFRALGVTLPAELEAADRQWFANRGVPYPAARQRPTPTAVSSSGDDSEHESGDEHGGGPSQQSSGGSPAKSGLGEQDDAEMAAVYTLPLNGDGSTFVKPGVITATASVDEQALAAALASGSDRRTSRRSDGTGVRLLTYRVPETTLASAAPAVLQVGRPLSDQERVLSTLLIGLVALSGVAALLLAIASWWLAGRSLRPAQESWERQQSFVANASHELRTPLTLMRATAEVALRETPEHERDRRELLGDILRETDHMTGLVEDLLLLSRLDAGRLTLDRRPLPVSDLLEDAQRKSNLLGVPKGVTTDISFAGGTALADAARTRQVLLILLDNALRFSPAGGKILLDGRPLDRGVQISVMDGGPGVPHNSLAHIFERFYRVQETSKAGSGGSGLGLSIARALVEAHGGRIWAANRPGGGLQVSFTLPGA